MSSIIVRGYILGRGPLPHCKGQDVHRPAPERKPNDKTLGYGYDLPVQSRGWTHVNRYYLFRIIVTRIPSHAR
jgi:hypothetical protein